MTKRASTQALIGGAIGLSLVSRAFGTIREGAIVTLVGVHDYTDAYFASSTVVLWLQNWAFGAFSLYVVPTYLALGPHARGEWFSRLARRGAVLGIVAGFLFWAAYGWIEAAMLGGRRVLTGAGPVALASCIPLTLAGGILHARLVASSAGIIRAAQALLGANVVGLAALAAAVLFANPADVLPFSLVATQLATLVSLARAQRHVEVPTTASDPGADPRSGVGGTGNQAMATTVENVGFNLNAISHQGLAGRLPDGAVTLNAYAMRLLLFPLVGLLQPIQQRLLVRFSSESRSSRESVLRLAVLTSVVLGAVLFVAVYVGLTLTAPQWAGAWSHPLSLETFIWTASSYALYAGVVFASQAVARFAFASGRGWTYALGMLGAYSAGTLLKVRFVQELGMLALPLGAIVGEGAALIFILALLRTSRKEASTTLTA